LHAYEKQPPLKKLALEMELKDVVACFPRPGGSWKVKPSQKPSSMLLNA